MNRMKKTVASIMVAAGVMLGATVVVPLSTAEKAQAYNTYNCSSVRTLTYLNSYVWTTRTTCYYDYNWWEEVLGYRDGWYTSYAPIYT
jgi:hypothetical protein